MWTISAIRPMSPKLLVTGVPTPKGSPVPPFPEGIDFALIDGIYRDHVTLFLLPKIRLGGVLVIDNVNRYLPRGPCLRFASGVGASCDRGVGKGCCGSLRVAPDLDYQRDMGYGDLYKDIRRTLVI